MPINIQQVKLVKNAAAAVMVANPDLNFTQVLTGFSQDLISGKQSLPVAGLDYLQSLKSGINSDVIPFLIAQDNSRDVSNLQPQLKAVMDLQAELEFTPQEALNWLQKLKPGAEAAVQLMKLASAKFFVLMAESRETFSNAAHRMLMVSDKFYIEGLQSWHIDELATPAFKFKLEVAARLEELEDEFEMAAEQGLTVDYKALKEIAEQQVKTGNLDPNAFPALKQLKAAAERKSIQFYGQASILPSPQFGNHDPKKISPNSNTVLNSLNSLTNLDPATTVLLASFLLLSTSVACMLLRPVSLLRCATGKVLGIFSKNDQGHTYVPVNSTPINQLQDSAEEQEVEATSSNWCCYRKAAGN